MHSLPPHLGTIPQIIRMLWGGHWVTIQLLIQNALQPRFILGGTPLWLQLTKRPSWLFQVSCTSKPRQETKAHATVGQVHLRSDQTSETDGLSKVHRQAVVLATEVSNAVVDL